jgi:response regulator RpfG family c-di-GMP phosphodiesterase
MDGYETTKAIRDGKAGRTHIDVPIIAMTASAMRGEREKCLEAGMDDFSTKPVMAEVLIPKVKHWLVEQMKKSGYKTDNVSPLVDKLMHNISEEVRSILATPPHERYWDKENAIARIKGDKALFSRVCSLFAHSAPDKVKLLEKAVAHRDVDQARTLTLKLKGMSSDIGAVQLQNDFEKLWECVSYEQWQDALNHLPTIQQDLITFLKIMDVA